SQSSSNGSGDLIINGNLTLGSTGVDGGTLRTGGVATFAHRPGKVIYNGDILSAAGATMPATLSVVNGNPATDPTFVSVVQLNGQNTFSTTSLSAAGADTAAGDANIQIGS